ncbi:MAG: DUF202 domain-containing protein [Oculatellaceae cyanobacterium Prado106]|jgi:putative membrane protein|nr:DUF202 domain-containing protein [Oculatellaceae cyanobacterium Prado106]
MQRSTSDVTELAKERNRQAAERTVASWIGSSLLLIGFGISFEEISAALMQAFPKNSSQFNTQLGSLVGLGAIAFGILLLVPVAIAHFIELKALEQENYLVRSPRSLYLFVAVGSVILFGIVVLVTVIFIVSQR